MISGLSPGQLAHQLDHVFCAAWPVSRFAVHSVTNEALLSPWTAPSRVSIGYSDHAR